MNEPAINPLLVYLVLQMDSFNVCAALLAVISLLAAGVCLGAGEGSHGEEEKAWYRRSYRFGVTSIIAFLLMILLPSTRTLAAMIVVPALTTPSVTEPLSREAGELYSLAKQALERAAEAPIPAPTPEPTTEEEKEK